MRAGQVDLSSASLRSVFSAAMTLLPPAWHAAQLPANSVSPDSMSPAKAAKGARSAPAASVAAATSLWASSLTDAACCAWGANGDGRGGEERDGELHFYVPVCRRRVRQCAAAIGTLCRDDGKRRPCRSRAWSILGAISGRAQQRVQGRPVRRRRGRRGGSARGV